MNLGYFATAQALYVEYPNQGTGCNPGDTANTGDYGLLVYGNDLNWNRYGCYTGFARPPWYDGLAWSGFRAPTFS